MTSLFKVWPILFSIIISLNGFSQVSKEIIFFDDFESYTLNEQLVCQNSEDWTTWDNLPCSYQDPFITDSIVWNEIKSIVIVDSNDLVKPIDNYTDGRYRISFKMHVPEGYCGYFNTLQIFDGINSNEGMQVLFVEGNAHITCPTATFFNYTQNSWFENKIIVDLDNDHARYFYNNQLIEEWQWSHGGSFSGINQLGGNEFYPWTNGSSGIAKFYIDDYKIEQLEPVELLPPINLNLQTLGSDIVLHWDSPFQEYWLHYDGENYGNGIGPGPIYTAARFLPEDIQDLDGWFLTKIKFFARNSDCTYSLRVWTGENAGNLIFEYDVPEFIPDSWNEVDLNSPILIDASQELWLGNVSSSPNAWDYPAACDEGPAIPYKGDLASFDGINWVSISLEYGLDYNWNIRGLVVENMENKENTLNLTQCKIKSNQSRLKNINIANLQNDGENKSLQGYNIYYSYNWVPFELMDLTTDLTWTQENLMTGYHAYYVTSLYDEGESISSDTVSALLTNIDKNDRFSIQVYPNPAKDFVQVNSEAKIDNLKIYDLKGQIKVVFFEINKKKLNLSVSGYNPGVYLFRLESDNKVVNKRIVIQ